MVPEPKRKRNTVSIRFYPLDYFGHSESSEYVPFHCVVDWLCIVEIKFVYKLFIYYIQAKWRDRKYNTSLCSGNISIESV